MTRAEDRLNMLIDHVYGTWRAQRGWRPVFITDADGVYMYDESKAISGFFVSINVL